MIKITENLMGVSLEVKRHDDIINNKVLGINIKTKIGIAIDFQYKTIFYKPTLFEYFLGKREKSFIVRDYEKESEKLLYLLQAGKR